MRRILLIVVIAVGVGGLVLWWTGRPQSDQEVRSAYLTEADRFVEVDGLAVRVREEGPTAAPPILLLHGFGVSLESWNGWADALDDDFRVIRVDLPGHGLTGPDPQERYANDDFEPFLESLLDALELTRVSIAGNSLGGLAAWRFAADNPDRVDRLILVAPGGFPLPDQPPEGEVPGPLRFFLCSAPKAIVRAGVETWFFEPSAVTDEMVDRVFALMRAPGNCDAMIRRLELWRLPDPVPSLQRIEAPTLVMWGRPDPVVPFAHAERFQAALPNDELVAYDDLGHVPQEEDPARTAADARAFLTAAN